MDQEAAVNSVCVECFYYEREEADGRLSHRCKRILKFRDGSSYAGISIPFEIDEAHDPFRVEGDKCGPTYKHWRSRHDDSANS